MHATLSVAGALPLATGAEALVRDHQRARAVEVLLGAVVSGPWRSTDRHGLIARAWGLLGERLEPEDSGGLTVLFVAEDADGVGVAGVGFGDVWGVQDGALRRLVPRKHPLLCPPGLGPEVPGVLTLERVPAGVVASLWGAEPTLPAVAELAARCGGRP